MREDNFKNKVTGITFIFSILVVMIHAYNIPLFVVSGNAPGAEGVKLLQNLVAQVIGPVAVPGFFMLSGYLFYRNFTMDQLPRKWTGRIKSVLLPYVVWNTLYYFGYVVFRSIPGLGGIVGEGQVTLTVENLADAIINFAYNPVFWYLQQLILLIALAPVFYVLLRNQYIAVFIMGLIAFLIYSLHTSDIINFDALFYYIVAAYMGLHHRKWIEETTDRRIGIMFLLASLFAVVLSFQTSQPLWTVMFRLLLPAAIWFFLPQDLTCYKKSWMQYGFFLYASHFIFVRGFNKGMALVLPHNALVSLLVWLIMPVAAVWIAWKLGSFIKTKIPPLWILLSGGRG